MVHVRNVYILVVKTQNIKLQIVIYRKIFRLNTVVICLSNFVPYSASLLYLSCHKLQRIKKYAQSVYWKNERK
jgi:hypothetical protein